MEIMPRWNGVKRKNFEDLLGFVTFLWRGMLARGGCKVEDSKAQEAI